MKRGAVLLVSTFVLALIAVVATFVGSKVRGQAVYTVPVGRVSSLYSNPAYHGALAVDVRTGHALVATTAGLSLVDIRRGTILSTILIPQGGSLTMAAEAGTFLVASAEVSLLDADRGMVMHMARATMYPVNMVVDRRTQRAFVLNGRGYGGHVLVVELRTGKVLRDMVVSENSTMDIGDFAVDHHTNRFFVAVPTDDSVRVFNGSTCALVAVSAVARFPHAIAVDERTGHVFVATNRGVTMLDGGTGKVLRATDLGAAPTTLVTDVRSRRVFVIVSANDSFGVAEGIRGIGMLDTGSGRLLRTIPVPENSNPAAIAVDEQANRVYITSQGPLDPTQSQTFLGNGTLYVLDAERGTLLRKLPVGVGPIAVAVDQPTGHVIVLNSGGTIRTTDAWNWMPSWLRVRLPLVSQHPSLTQIVPGSVSVIDAAR